MQHGMRRSGLFVSKDVSITTRAAEFCCSTQTQICLLKPISPIAVKQAKKSQLSLNSILKLAVVTIVAKLQRKDLCYKGPGELAWKT